MLPKTLPKNYDSPSYRALCAKASLDFAALPAWGAAVVVALVAQHIFLLKRADKSGPHAGQLALPGGKREKGENNPAQTALREWEEETGLSASQLKLEGLLPPAFVGTGEMIVPFVATYQSGLAHFHRHIRPNQEWEGGLLLPLEGLFAPDFWRQAARFGAHTSGTILFAHLAGKKIAPVAVPVIGPGDLLWGATARILWYYTRAKSAGSDGALR